MDGPIGNALAWAARPGASRRQVVGAFAAAAAGAVLGRLVPGPLPVGAAPPAASPAPERRPQVVDGRYRLPTGDEPVIEAIVNRGPLPPMYQAGYEVTIDATGRATVTESPLGAKATPATASERTSRRELGVDGLQDVLAELDAAGFFALPQPGEPGTGEPLVGGPSRDVIVTLADGTWRAELRRLRVDTDRLEAALQLITAAAGVSPDLCAAFDTCLTAPGAATPDGTATA